MANHPKTKQKHFFVDKCLPFGHSISCALFQEFSDALAHMVKYLLRVKKGIEDTALTNYLDDFLFAAILESLCNLMLNTFLEMCNRLGVPISTEKTEWATTRIVFLGILLDGEMLILVVPEEKKLTAINLLDKCTTKRTVRVKEIQSLAGLLNFLNRAIYSKDVFQV